MASSSASRTPAAAPAVGQTYRYAAKIGEDFLTVECTVTLPLGATDEMIAQAVALSARIHSAQVEAVGAQVAASRWASAQAHDNVPATTDQKRAIARLVAAKKLGAPALDELAAALGIDRAQLTKGAASTLLDALQQVRVAAPAPAPAGPAVAAPSPDELFGASDASGAGDTPETSK